MPLTEGTTLLHPERALLKWEGISNRSDIGQICYLTRDMSSTRHTRTLSTIQASAANAPRSYACW